MERRNFAQILEEAEIIIEREYERLYCSFFVKGYLMVLVITCLCMSIVK